MKIEFENIFVNEQTPPPVKLMALTSLVAVLHKAAETIINTQGEEVQPRYFGDPWPCVFCLAAPAAPVPLGERCEWCEEGFTPEDQGALIPLFEEHGMKKMAFHKNCFLRSVVCGSVGHIHGTCACHGGTEDDPPGMTKRQAADAAVQEWESLQDRKAGVEHFPS